MKVGDNNVIESKGKSQLIILALVRFCSCKCREQLGLSCCS